MGSELSASNFDAQVYSSYFTREPNGHLVGSSDEIERLRPKSPPPPPSVAAAATMASVAQRTRAGVLSINPVTPSLLGKPTSSGRLLQLPNTRHHALGAAEQNAMLNLLSLSAQNRISNFLLAPPGKPL